MIKEIKKLIIILLLISNFSIFAQNYTLSGYVKDAENGETIISSKIHDNSTGKAKLSNEYGFYSITLPSGLHEIEVSFSGYTKFTFSINLDKNITKNIELQQNSKILKEVVVKEKKLDHNTKSTEMGVVEIKMEDIKKIPALMGEVDILKTIQLTPGVQSGGEGNTGLYVRGGSPDQNLILLDEAIVYNASHLFGFFSVFNADAVKNMKLTKAGMSAEYAGRLSSVLDIKMKEGNNKELQIDGGIGIIASRLTIQAPIIKDKSSFLISGRRTYIDILAKPIIKNLSTPIPTYYFYDFNAKLNYTLNKKNNFYLSGYFGKDVFSFIQDEIGLKVPWGNATGTLRWNHIINEKLFLNSSAIYSTYDFNFKGISQGITFGLKSFIRDWNFKSNLTYFLNDKHELKTGLNVIFHKFSPSNFSAENEDLSLDFKTDKKVYGIEYGTFVEDQYNVSDRLSINAGLRLSSFQHIGPFTRYITTNNNIDSTKNYNKNQTVVLYIKPEPRLNIRYTIDSNSSIKLGATINYQYVHLVSTSGGALPTDYWLPTTDKLNPESAKQISLGYYRNFKDNMFETSIEVFYKKLHNILEFREGAQPSDQIFGNVDDNLVKGDGISYGLELYFKKKFGKFNGWIGYTLSRSERQFDDINNGEKFLSKWDRTHDISIVAIYDISEKWSLASTFVFATGDNITLPLSRYYVENIPVVENTKRNGYRMPAYHRMDFSANYYNTKYKEVKDIETGTIIKKEKRFTTNWNFSVFNLYNRKNPYLITFTNEITDTGYKAKATQVSLFPILPSITWNFNFN